MPVSVPQMIFLGPQLEQSRRKMHHLADKNSLVKDSLKNVPFGKTAAVCQAYDLLSDFDKLLVLRWNTYHVRHLLLTKLLQLIPSKDTTHLMLPHAVSLLIK